MLMQDDTVWNDFGCYSGGGAASAIRPQMLIGLAKAGAMFRVVRQAVCTAGRASFITGRIPIRSASQLWSPP